MTTSRTISKLSKPNGHDRIPEATLAYLQTRNRMHAFSVVLEAFEKADITKAELAHRLGKGSDRIAHLLGAPGNWTLDTISDLLFAINGSELTYNCASVLDEPSAPSQADSAPSEADKDINATELSSAV